MMRCFPLDYIVLFENMLQVSVKIKANRPNYSTYMYDMQDSWPEFSSNFINQYDNVCQILMKMVNDKPISVKYVIFPRLYLSWDE